MFLFWTAPGNSLLVFRYTDSFLLRFPLLYIAFFCVGVFFEFIRYTTQKELAEMRKKYEQLSKHDPLTGLFNRLGYYEDIEEIISKGTENGCAAAIIDFDNFKSINDRFGHDSGDTVLEESSKKIVSIVGEHGSVCRWGGDELSVFFNRADAAEKLCEKILTEIRELEFDFLKGGHITVSIGLTVFPSEDEFEIEDFINSADINLYKSKNTGKDQLIVTQYVPNGENIGAEALSAMK